METKKGGPPVQIGARAAKYVIHSIGVVSEAFYSSR
jgi:hypothetical protein